MLLAYSFTLFHLTLFSIIMLKKTAKVKSNDDSRAKHKAITGRLNDYFGFKLSENGSVLSVENVYSMILHFVNLPLAACT